MKPNKPSFNSTFFLIVLVLFIAGWGYIKYREFVLPTTQISINNQLLTVEVAANPKAWQKGLSGRKSLAPDSGMLFVFPTARREPFWMKGMNFSIDIIWINQGKIIDIAPNVAPCFIEPLPVYLPRLPAQAVLEVPAGFSVKNSLKIGDKVEVLTK